MSNKAQSSRTNGKTETAQKQSSTSTNIQDKPELNSEKSELVIETEEELHVIGKDDTPPEIEKVEETPFNLITLGEHSFGAFGNYRITEFYNSKTLCMEALKKFSWDRLVQICTLLNELQTKDMKKNIEMINKKLGITMVLLMAVTLTAMATGTDLNVNVDPPTDNKTILGIVVIAAYEILSRVIPTVKDYTIVGRLIKWIHKVSDILNVTKQ